MGFPGASVTLEIPESGVPGSKVNNPALKMEKDTNKQVV